MERSERALVALGTVATFLVACQAVIGLDKYKKDKGVNGNGKDLAVSTAALIRSIA